jgi:hypothetical protein
VAIKHRQIIDRCFYSRSVFIHLQKSVSSIWNATQWCRCNSHVR